MSELGLSVAAYLLSMDSYEVIGGCDDDILWGEFTHIYC